MGKFNCKLQKEVTGQDTEYKCNTNFTVKELWQNLKYCHSTLFSGFTHRNLLNNYYVMSRFSEIYSNKSDDKSMFQPLTLENNLGEVENCDCYFFITKSIMSNRI